MRRDAMRVNDGCVEAITRMLCHFLRFSSVDYRLQDERKAEGSRLHQISARQGRLEEEEAGSTESRPTFDSGLASRIWALGISNVKSRREQWGEHPIAPARILRLC